jgi:hypothetical protein
MQQRRREGLRGEVLTIHYQLDFSGRYGSTYRFHNVIKGRFHLP